jgi:hypothetical protein
MYSTGNTDTFCKFLGAGYDKIISKDEEIGICALLGEPIGSLKFYKRANIHGTLYHSKDHSRVKVRNSYTVKYKDTAGTTQFGIINWFAENKACDGSASSFACIQKLDQITTDLWSSHHEGLQPDEYICSNFMQITIPHIHPVLATKILKINPVCNIMDLCIFISLEDTCMSFVCEEPNHYELNL